MQTETKPKKQTAQLIFNQALFTAVGVNKAEAIVDLAFAAAEVAMNKIEKSGDVKLVGIAKETLDVARRAAAEILNDAKKEAEEMVRLTNQEIGD
jgi:hypothetical protein